jgi:hypothetical protein
MVRTHLPPYEFRAETWENIARRAAEIADLSPQLAYLNDLVTSIRDSGVEDRLAASFSMMDLRVTDVPIHEPPVEYVAVQGPSSLAPPPIGMVRVAHCTASGRDDSIERPSAETIPLFWRFVREKFGIEAARRT